MMLHFIFGLGIMMISALWFEKYPVLFVIGFGLYIILYVGTQPFPNEPPVASPYDIPARLTQDHRPGTNWYNEFLMERPLVDTRLYTDFTKVGHPLTQVHLSRYEINDK